MTTQDQLAELQKIAMATPPTDDDDTSRLYLWLEARPLNRRGAERAGVHGAPVVAHAR